VVNWFDTMSQSSHVHGSCWRYMTPDMLDMLDPTHGALFDRRALLMSEQQVREVIMRLGLAFPNARARNFLKFAESFWGKFEGDPLRVFALEEDITTLARRCKKERIMLGYGPKLLSLLALYLYDFDAHKKLYPGAYPADRHIQRQMIRAGVVELSDGSTDVARGVAETIRTHFPAILQELGICVFAAAHAQWFLGSYVCATCHKCLDPAAGELGTRSVATLCPLWEGSSKQGLCVGGMGTSSYHNTGKW